MYGDAERGEAMNDQPTCSSFLLVNGRPTDTCPNPVDYDGDNCTQHGGY